MPSTRVGPILRTTCESQASEWDVTEVHRTTLARALLKPAQWPGPVVRLQAEDRFTANLCNKPTALPQVGNRRALEHTAMLWVVFSSHTVLPVLASPPPTPPSTTTTLPTTVMPFISLTLSIVLISTLPCLSRLSISSSVSSAYSPWLSCWPQRSSVTTLTQTSPGALSARTGSRSGKLTNCILHDFASPGPIRLHPHLSRTVQTPVTATRSIFHHPRYPPSKGVPVYPQFPNHIPILTPPIPLRPLIRPQALPCHSSFSLQTPPDTWAWTRQGRLGRVETCRNSIYPSNYQRAISTSAKPKTMAVAPSTAHGLFN